MKKLLGILILAAGMAAIPAGAQTQQVVGVQFSETGLQGLYGPNGYTSGTANYTAGTPTAGNGGDYFVDNWNSVFVPAGDRNGTASPLTGSGLTDSTGAVSPISFSVAYQWADNTANTNVNFPKPDGSNAFPFYLNSGTADALLAGTGIAESSGPITLSISGLTAGDTYTLIAYVSSLYFAGPTTAEWDAGGQTFYTDPTNGTGLSSWVQGVAATSGAAAPSNYVEFDNLTNLTTLTLTGEGVGSGQPALMGFQIIQTATAAVPEPSTMGTIVLGFFGLVAFQRKRFFPKS